MKETTRDAVLGVSIIVLIVLLSLGTGVFLMQTDKYQHEEKMERVKRLCPEIASDRK